MLELVLYITLKRLSFPYKLTDLTDLFGYSSGFILKVFTNTVNYLLCLYVLLLW